MKRFQNSNNKDKNNNCCNDKNNDNTLGFLFRGDQIFFI